MEIKTLNQKSCFACNNLFKIGDEVLICTAYLDTGEAVEDAIICVDCAALFTDDYEEGSC